MRYKLKRGNLPQCHHPHYGAITYSNLYYEKEFHSKAIQTNA